MNEKSNYNNNGRVAVVTGSSKGIGKAIAMEFARAGYSVVINARNEEALKLAAKHISQSVKEWKGSLYTWGYIAGACLHISDRECYQTIWKDRCTG